MANRTRKSKALITTAIDMTKPIVKENINKNEEISRYIEMMLPHQPYSKIKIMHLHTSKDSKISKFRINWYREFLDGFTKLNKITASKYITIEHLESGYKIN